MARRAIIFTAPLLVCIQISNINVTFHFYMTLLQVDPKICHIFKKQYCQENANESIYTQN